MYRQVDGISMGCSLGPLMVTILVESQEIQVWKGSPNHNVMFIILILLLILHHITSWIDFFSTFEQSPLLKIYDGRKKLKFQFETEWQSCEPSLSLKHHVLINQILAKILIRILHSFWNRSINVIMNHCHKPSNICRLIPRFNLKL